MKKIIRTITHIKTLLFPSRCCCCGDPAYYEGIICETCLERLIREIRPRIINVSNGKLKVLSIWPYGRHARTLVTRSKYNDSRVLQAFLPAINELSGCGKNFFKGIGYVIPVPLHNNKLRKRGYNQSFILARHISRIWGPELAQNILFKNKDTPAQVELKREQRYANVEGCFLAKPFKRLPETKILLVDDVLTTGATMSACASELERSGLTNIMGFTLCYSTLS